MALFDSTYFVNHILKDIARVFRGPREAWGDLSSYEFSQLAKSVYFAHRDVIVDNPMRTPAGLIKFIRAGEGANT